MDQETANYIIDHYPKLLTNQEGIAIRHVSSSDKLKHSVADNTALTQAYREKGWLTSDPTVLDLLKDGYDHFERTVAQRILAQNEDAVFLNYCPHCGRLARTPQAQQCRHCGHKWHKKSLLAADTIPAIDQWITALEHYNFVQLCTQPAPGSWSLGQVYVHLIHQADYYVEQIKTCLSNDDHAAEEMSPRAKAMFRDNAFPDILIEGPATNIDTPQPVSKEEIMQALLDLKKEFIELEISIGASPFKGKTKHPGLHYFSATDWLQFTGMHLRHHLRQKQRIDDFLKTI